MAMEKKTEKRKVLTLGWSSGGKNPTDVVAGFKCPHNIIYFISSLFKFIDTIHTVMKQGYSRTARHERALIAAQK